MGKWNNRDESKRTSELCLKQKSTEDLKNAKKFLSGLLDLRKAEKLNKTYISGTLNAIEYNGHPKVYMDFRFDGTATGRLSCATYKAKKAMGVSFHTLPREKENNIRSLFSAPKDYNFVAADYAAMELRVLSHIAKEEGMQKAFIDGVDLHTYTAQLLFNKQEITKEERQIAKTVSFLIVYGGGAYNLSETVGISLPRANKIISNYEKVYPGIFSYMNHVNEYIRENKHAYTIFGRRRNLPDVGSKDFKVVNRALRQGLNFTIQSTASDILLCALLGISNRFKALGLNARPVATVHDSIEVVCPKEETEEVAKIMYDEMVNYPTVKDLFNIHFAVPLAIDLEIGSSFGDGEEVLFINGIPQL